MKALGLGHFTFLDLDPVALIRLARASGFAFVGLRFHPVAPGQLHYRPPPGSAAMTALRRAIADEGVGVYDIETIVLDAGFDPDALRPVIDAAAEVGAERLNVCAEDWDRGALVTLFGRLCDLAGAAGIGVDIECMAWRGIDTPGKCLEVIEAAGRPNAGVLVDALHLDRCGGTPAEVAAMPPARVVSAQLCDAPRGRPKRAEALIAEARGGRLMPGAGGLPLAELVAALPEHTVVSVEAPMARDDRPPPLRARHIRDATMRLLAQRLDAAPRYSEAPR